MALNQTVSVEGIAQEEPSINFVQICELIIGCFGIVGNLTCVFVLGRHSVRNHTNWLIVNQAVVDALVSFFLVAAVSTKVAGVSTKTMNRTSGDIFCKFWGSFCVVFAGFAISTFNLTAISIERYIAVVHPMWYLSHFKRRAMLTLITLIWLLAPVLQIVTVSTQYGVMQNGECNFYPKNSQILVALFFWEYFIPICIMTFSFVAIIIKFRKLNKIAIERTREIQRQPPVAGTSLAEHDQGGSERTSSSQATRIWHTEASTSRAGNATSPRKGNRRNDQRNQKKVNAVGRIQRRNTTKVLFAVYIIFLICWSPNQWAFLQFNLGGHLDFNSHFYRFTVVMGILSTCINPFIYALRLKIYQREMKAIIQSFYCTTS